VLNADQPRDDSVRKRGSRRKSSRNRRAEHILIVTYLYAPCDAINVRRPRQRKVNMAPEECVHAVCDMQEVSTLTSTSSTLTSTSLYTPLLSIAE